MVKILDCTLRDGGYCNQWKFGKKNINFIVNELLKSGVNIIECGFLNKSVSFDDNSTKMPTVENFSSIIPPDRKNTLFVCMLNFGDGQAEDIPNREDNFIDGIRVAFHKKNILPALELCRKLKDKGYKIFIQAMVSLSYTDEEFLSLIRQVNEFKPYAFYIVDSFGTMKKNDLLRLFYMVEHNLSQDIAIGYHSHNNMQLSYSNAQILADVKTKHNIIIDSSVFGMGRGAGNLNTELFVEYLNENINSHYNVQPLLKIVDEVLANFYNKHPWGYSLPFYLSASLGYHPNYAIFLAEKETLPMKNFYELLQSISPEDRGSFNRGKAEIYYRQYLERPYDDRNNIEELKKIFYGKDILLLAPGNSLIEYLPKIQEEMHKKNRLTVSINFADERFDTDYIFVSNMRKYKDLQEQVFEKIIATSNILDNSKSKYIINFSDYTSEYPKVVDNAGLMALHFLRTVCCTDSKIFIAGMDGYVSYHGNNFLPLSPETIPEVSIEEKNIFIAKELKNLKKIMDINFLTPTLYKMEEI